MRRPKPAGTAIDQRRFRDWQARFSGYRDHITRSLLEEWVGQFADEDKDLAGRILDAVLFLGYQHARDSFKDLLTGLPGWHWNESRRRGKWYFVPFSASSGESGDSMTHQFRIANGMDNKYWKNNFIHRSELAMVRPEDSVVLIDDFAGSGKQACEAWQDVFSELLAARPYVYLLLLGATSKAEKRIAEETGMIPRCRTRLGRKDDLFDEKCVYFSEKEKDRVLALCKMVDPKNPKGFGESGLLFAFHHQCPNNSLPILHKETAEWMPIFPRS